MALGKEEKESQLKELASIVTGIRLFNRDCGKGGEGIDDRELLVYYSNQYCTSLQSIAVYWAPMIVLEDWQLLSD